MQATRRSSEASFKAELELRQLLTEEAEVQGHEFKHDPTQETGITLLSLIEAVGRALKSITSEVGDWYSTSTTNRLKAYQKQISANCWRYVSMIADNIDIFAQEMLILLKNIVKVLDSHVNKINMEEEEVAMMIAEIDFAISRPGEQNQPQGQAQSEEGEHNDEEEREPMLEQRSDELYKNQQILSQHLRLRQDRQPLHTKHLRQCSAFKSSLENGILFVMLNALVNATNENRARTVQKLYKTRRQYDVKRRKLDPELC